MSKRILLGLVSSVLLAAAGCSHASRATASGPTPNVGGDAVDQSSARNNTDPAVADPPPGEASRPAGTGSAQQ